MNDEARMSKDEGMTKPERVVDVRALERFSSFGFRHFPVVTCGYKIFDEIEGDPRRGF